MTKKSSLLLLLAENAILAALYIGVAKFGLGIDAVSGFASLVWPPTGISLAALLTVGLRLWPSVSLGAFVVNVWTGAPVLVAFGIAVGNTLEAILGAYAIKRLLGSRFSLSRLRDVLVLITFAALLSTVVSASMGALSLRLGKIITDAELSPTWRAWWLGDVIGDLVVAPLLLAWGAERARIHLNTGRLVEALLLGASTLLLCFFVFNVRFPEKATAFRQAYMLFPLLMWAALRFDQRGPTTVTFAVSALAIVGTAQGLGPFVRPSLHDSLVHLQAFMAIYAITALILSAIISERTRAEGEVREAVRARDEFLSVASHEFRTPLSALMLQMTALQRLLRKAKVESSNGKIIEKVERAVKSTERLTKLVDNLLDVSRIATGHLELRREECDLSAVSRDVVERVNAEANRAGCELLVHADTPVTGLWDRLRVEQVLMNLLSNAFKYGPGKPVEVSVGVVDGSATLGVRDHGIGISKEDLERIFHRFERAAPGRHHGGLGLGLYITRQIVIALGGTIHVTSEPGGGSLFAIELPRRPLSFVTPSKNGRESPVS